ncbi:MAG: RelA/SpoT family protein [bacterium]
MVKVRNALPRTPQGEVNVPLWVDQLVDAHEQLDANAIENTVTWLAQKQPDQLVMALELAELVAQLNMDQASVQAGLIYRAIREERVSPEQAEMLCGAEACRIASAVAQMATTSLLEMSNSPLQEKEQQDQVENIKRMLASLIDDARVAVVKLAERVAALRRAKTYDPERRQRVALEASRVFAPLAGRLGIWQLKWELEDLSLRYTREDVYLDIARQLKGKRAEREVQVEHMIDQVRGLLRGHGIDAVVYGRAKHIYSIWRKMQSKNVSFDQVYDVRAVRIVVNTLAECYAALGVIHTTWRHLPSEFDDYIANPKENGYQSIHTAVTASDGRVLEIQIRTAAMHEDAELGVCAHWSYKDGRPEDGGYAAKMDWLRQVMEWHEDLAGTESISTLLQHRISQNRIFVSTPKGHVLELPPKSTILDFAYRVHTDIGHTCKGGLVNGVLAPLSRRLETGQQVEVITSADAQPQRDWLEESLGFVHSDRARAKLVAYFRQLPAQDQQRVGEQSVCAKLAALGLADLSAEQLQALAARNGHAQISGLWQAVGSGELSAIRVIVGLADDASILSAQDLPGNPAQIYPLEARFRLTAHNRDGLLHDITQVIGDLEIALTGTTGRVSNASSQAIISVDVTLSSWQQRVEFVSYLGLIEGVTEIRTEAI